jgi:hypothetical protein
LRKLAAAAVSGLVAYFLGTTTHTTEITSVFATLPQQGEYWSETVKQYVIDKAYPRPPRGSELPNFNKVIYNGEIPLAMDGQPLCAVVKRQEFNGPSSCVSPASASAMSLASASSASVASISSASIASVSSASVVSVSSAEARSSRIATAIQPSFTGYLGDVCAQGLSTNLNLDDANDAVQQFCSGDWIWPAAGQPPTGIPPIGVNGTGVSGANFTATIVSLASPGAVTTNLEVSPDDGKGACSVGGYPRSLGIVECLSGFNSLFSFCK